MRLWAAGALAMTFAGAACLSAQELLDPEVPLTFAYQGVVRVEVFGVYRDDVVYLPLATLLRHLDVDVDYDATRGRARGRVPSGGDAYDLDLRAGHYLVGGAEVAIHEGAALWGALDAYLTPSAFADLFGLHFEVHFEDLRLSLTTEHRLPVADHRATKLRPARIPKPHAALWAPRERSRFRLGEADYALGGVLSDGRFAGRYDFDLGGEILGGDIRGRLRGTTAGVRAGGLRWRLVPAENRWLRQVLAGEMVSAGLRPSLQHGVRFTNTPIHPQRQEQSHFLRGRTQPGWSVEARVRGYLLGRVVADDAGAFALPVPLTQGTSRVVLVYRSPDGEVEEEERRIEIPRSLLPAGALRYTFDLGRREDAGVAGLNLGVGLHDRLSVRLGLDAEPRDGAGGGVTTHASGVARLGDRHVLGLDVAPEGVIRGSVDGTGIRGITWAAGAGRLDPDRDPAGTRSEGYVRAFIPGRGLSLRLDGRYAAYLHRPDNLRYRAEVDARIGRTRASAGYLMTRSVGETAGTYLHGSLHWSPAALERTSLRAHGRVDLAQGTWSTVGAEATFRAWSGHQFRATWERGRSSGDGLQLGISYNLQGARGATSIRRLPGGPIVASQSLRGSAGIDAHGGLTLSDRAMVGRSRALLRLFVDEDGSGIYRQGMPLVEGDALRFREPVRRRLDARGGVVVEGLRPYDRYSVDIDPSRLPDPMLVPAVESFSFVTDPAQGKVIDIPLRMGGVLIGSVLHERWGQRTPVPGLRVLLRRIDSDDAPVEAVPVFSDGAIFHSGLLPGEYDIRIDPDQLTALGARSEPASRRVSVRPTTDGDVVEGVEFILQEADTE